ncbi:hypothetical protein [Novosphingobium sp. AAP83]|uniref:hypothetical protein n=1 Tax=Novosphingobium sp. AAP83 TaxID=1523425 RepID=UPI0006B9C857|nr:hypothetical protein [Novosphingobium sp. AAP83]
MIEAIVLGATIGALVESGKRGLIKSWGNTEELPPLVKAAMLVILIGIPAIHAGTVGNYVITTLATVGAFTVARWSVASLSVLWQRVLR